MSNLLIIGASVRAAAASALRAGLSPWCVDLFGDADLRRACPVTTVPLERYARGLIDQLEHGPPGPWMYTGGLENYPELLDGSRELWGNPGDVVRAVRDPARLAAALKGFDVPRLGPPTVDRTWLVKPLRGSSGNGVRRWISGESVARGCYLQEFIAGDVASAAYIAVDGVATLLGATRQLVGCDWLHVPRPFQYAGSIGPISHPRLAELGQTLVDAFDLRGVFGVDFVLASDRIWPLEVNPRYPASFEILERISGRPLLVGQAFQPAEPRFAPTRLRQAGKPAPRHHGKAILYANRDLVVPSDCPWHAAFDHALSDLDVPFADVPPIGQVINRGDPIVTFFAAADSLAACESELRKIAADLDRFLAMR